MAPVDGVVDVAAAEPVVVAVVDAAELAVAAAVASAALEPVADSVLAGVVGSASQRPASVATRCSVDCRQQLIDLPIC